MVYTFKRNGVRAAVQTHTGVITPLETLTYDMLNQLTPPLPPELPMDTRYFFAKYDSGDLKAAYATIRGLYENDMPSPASSGLTQGWLFPEQTEDPAAILRTYAENRMKGQPFCLYIGVASSIPASSLLSMARELLPDAQIVLHIPASLYGKMENVDTYMVHVGDIAGFTEATYPLDTMIVADFDKNTELAAHVTRILDMGYTLSAVPKKDTPVEDALTQYDALSRVLTRRRRTDKSFVFLPFTLACACPGSWSVNGNTVQGDTQSMPGYYNAYGLQTSLFADITSTSLYTRLAEYAIVLQLN